MKSDIEYVEESIKRVLFKANKKDEINRTEGILSDSDTCFTWEAYIRVSDHYWVRYWALEPVMAHSFQSLSRFL